MTGGCGARDDIGGVFGVTVGTLGMTSGGVFEVTVGVFGGCEGGARSQDDKWGVLRITDGWR